MLRVDFALHLITPELHRVSLANLTLRIFPTFSQKFKKCSVYHICSSFRRVSAIERRILVPSTKKYTVAFLEVLIL